MSNREKGEVAVEIGGTSYTLCLDMSAMIALEDHFTKQSGREVFFGEIFEKVLRNSMRHVQAFIWATFLKHHPDKTLQDVNDLVQQAGGIFKFSGLISELGPAASPDAADLRALGIDPAANPQKAQPKRRRGTGQDSTSRPAASA